jgi:putative DNA primase/helicase
VVLGDKDSYQQLQGRWMYEMGELDAMGKAEITKVKLYIASQSDYFRASFDRRARDYPRQVVFGGTTNDDQYLIDSSGNRRFWPVRVTRQVDLDWVRENRDQLFAEAAVRLAAGKRWYPLPDEEKALFVPQQEARRAVGAIEAAIVAYLYDEEQKVGISGINGSLVREISANELLLQIGFTLDKQTDLVHKRCTAALRRLEWQHRKSSRPGRPWVYTRPKARQGNAASASDGSSTGHAGPQPAGASDDCPF